jgi:hydroxymethylpyrimidine pyrophosphatase-like HAD family hydrolase
VKQLFIADLDDTLLSAGVLPPGVLAPLRRIIDSGAHFTVATARGLRAAVDPLKDALPRLPIIASNGAVVAYADGSQSAIKNLDPETLSSVVRLADGLGAAHCLVASNGRDDVVFAPTRGDEFTDWSIDKAAYFKAQAIVRGRPPTDVERAQVIQLVICSTVRKIETLEHLVKFTYPSVSTVIIRSRDMPDFAWFEIASPNATKAYAIKYLASLFNCQMKDVVYYGEAASDLGAMNLAGEAVAVANAEADVLLAADRVIEDARDGGRRARLGKPPEIGVNPKGGPKLNLRGGIKSKTTPAKAGAYRSVEREAEIWVPAFAGMDVQERTLHIQVAGEAGVFLDVVETEFGAAAH